MSINYSMSVLIEFKSSRFIDIVDHVWQNMSSIERWFSVWSDHPKIDLLMLAIAFSPLIDIHVMYWEPTCYITLIINLNIYMVLKLIQKIHLIMNHWIDLDMYNKIFHHCSMSNNTSFNESVTHFINCNINGAVGVGQSAK